MEFIKLRFLIIGFINRIIIVYGFKFKIIFYLIYIINVLIIYEILIIFNFDDRIKKKFVEFDCYSNFIIC